MEIQSLLKEVREGALVLPDFQRSFIWEPENIRELLVSILGDYFIGSMLVMEAIRDAAPFALRLIEGVKEVNPEAQIQLLVKILLDGQQRTTALFYAMYEVPLPLKGRKNPYKFYINLEEALSQNWDDAVIAISVADRKRLSEIENNEMIIPIILFKNIGELSKKFRDNPDFERIIDLANNFLNYEIHMVTLQRSTGLNKIVETFERINRTGEPLSIIDLVTARLYKHEIRIRDLIENSRERYTFIKAVQGESILKVIALIREKEPKRKKLLELEPENFKNDWEFACQYLQKAYERILDIKNGYGVLDFKKWMPYSTMIVPLAALMYFIETERLQSDKAYRKIDVWYWTSVFSNRYDQAVDTTSFNDFELIKKWIKDENKVPEFISKFNPEEIDFDVDKQNSSIYRGVINLITLKGAYDFKTGQPPQFVRNKVQDDHIFPKSIYRENRIANRTIISTNQSKINKKPSEYFRERINEIGEQRVKEILATHLIPAEALPYLLNDDLEKFMELRKLEIINEIRERVKYK